MLVDSESTRRSLHDKGDQMNSSADGVAPLNSSFFSESQHGRHQRSDARSTAGDLDEGRDQQDGFSRGSDGKAKSVGRRHGDKERK